MICIICRNSVSLKDATIKRRTYIRVSQKSKSLVWGSELLHETRRYATVLCSSRFTSPRITKPCVSFHFPWCRWSFLLRHIFIILLIIPRFPRILIVVSARICTRKVVQQRRQESSRETRTNRTMVLAQRVNAFRTTYREEKK